MRIHSIDTESTALSSYSLDSIQPTPVTRSMTSLLTAEVTVTADRCCGVDAKAVMASGKIGDQSARLSAPSAEYGEHTKLLASTWMSERARQQRAFTARVRHGTEPQNRACRAAHVPKGE